MTIIPVTLVVIYLGTMVCMFIVLAKIHGAAVEAARSSEEVLAAYREGKQIADNDEWEFDNNE